LSDQSPLPVPVRSHGRRWLNSWWPSARVGVDPLKGLCIDGRYTPVSVANWKLIPSVARVLLSRRVAMPLSFETGKHLTVVIPFRDREHHLLRLVPVLTATLNEQHVPHRILVVEQQGQGILNRGRLRNIGVLFAADSTDYYCLHDVDAVPVIANYLCPSQPLRLVNRIDNGRGVTLRDDHYFSGAVCIRKEQMFVSNGYSNEYWGWGKEDDDFFFRMLLAGLLCYYDIRGEFLNLPNPRQQQIHEQTAEARRLTRLNRRRRSRLLRGLHDPAHDGLSSLRYHVVDHAKFAGYEKIIVTW
jgi:N-terminal region of glycosyl transferase group 7/N-terminal domain of galactosyltransferase